MQRVPVVLFVDDHARTVAVCRAALEKIGFSVEACASLRRAARELPTIQPSLVVLDAGLADGDVVGFCSRVRRENDIPVVITFPPRSSARLVEEWRERCDGYLTKPFRASELARRVASLIEANERPSAARTTRPPAAPPGIAEESIAYDLAGDGAGMPPVAEIGGCRIERVLGRGATGTVCLGRHILLDVVVAVKLVSASQAGWSSEDRERFIRGARAAAGIQHPNLVPVLNAGREGDFYFLVQRYIEGASLQHRIDSGGSLSEADALGLLHDVASALAMVHRNGLIHRDVKPGNIIMTPEGRAMLTDFGLARPAGLSNLSGASNIIGTPFYMAPEQCEGKALDGRSDLYSLGVTVYHAMTREMPITGKTPLEVLRNHVAQRPIPIRDRQPEVSEELATIVTCLLAKLPSERFDLADALLDAVTRLRDPQNP